MKKSTLSLTGKVTPQAHPALYWLFSDTLVLARRQFMHVLRVPDELVTSSLQPILFVVLFRYIFGGAIAVPGTSYVNYLIAGILVQSVILGSAFTGIGVANDLQRGLVDRFRSLPMAKSAVLTGRTLADLLRSTFIILIVWAVGLLVGFRPEGMILNWIGALGLLLLASLMFSWFSALLGLLLSSVEAVQQSIVVWAFPLMFASSALVPTSTMPDWLRPFAEHQPVSLLINSVRGLVLNQVDASTSLSALAWCVGLLVVFIPLSIWAYGRRTTR
jgi:ABC transporter DrrB family efflux protein